MRLLLSGIAVVLLAGCTSTGGYQVSAKSEVDWDKVNAVERAANSGSVHNRVIWVNPPLKKNTPEESEEVNGES